MGVVMSETNIEFHEEMWMRKQLFKEDFKHCSLGQLVGMFCWKRHNYCFSVILWTYFVHDWKLLEEPPQCLKQRMAHKVSTPKSINYVFYYVCDTIFFNKIFKLYCFALKEINSNSWMHYMNLCGLFLINSSTKIHNVQALVIYQDVSCSIGGKTHFEFQSVSSGLPRCCPHTWVCILTPGLFWYSCRAPCQLRWICHKQKCSFLKSVHLRKKETQSERCPNVCPESAPVPLSNILKEVCCTPKQGIHSGSKVPSLQQKWHAHHPCLLTYDWVQILAMVPRIIKGSSERIVMQRLVTFLSRTAARGVAVEVSLRVRYGPHGSLWETHTENGKVISDNCMLLALYFLQYMNLAAVKDNCWCVLIVLGNLVECPSKNMRTLIVTHMEPKIKLWIALKIPHCIPPLVPVSADHQLSGCIAMKDPYSTEWNQMHNTYKTPSVSMSLTSESAQFDSLCPPPHQQSCEQALGPSQW